MFAARSFSYTGMQRRGEKKERSRAKAAKRSKSANTEPSPHRGFGWRPESFAKHQEEQARLAEVRDRTRRNSEEVLSIKAVGTDISNVLSSSLPKPSQPVAVPQRSSSKSSHRTQPSAFLAPPPNDHLPRNRLSAASILAQTAIPARRTFPPSRPKTISSRKISIDDVVGEWRQTEFEYGTPPGVSPAMDALLSTPECSESEMGPSLEDDSATGLSRSISIDSMPSLQRSDSASGLSCSSVSSPEISFRSYRRKRLVFAASPRSVESSADHPLLDLPCMDSPEDEGGAEYALYTSSVSTPRRPSSRSSALSRSPPPTPHSPSLSSTSRRRSFKSNLTTSLATLRNNLSRSFSNFSAPSSTDPITQSLLTTPYHPEMRPRPLSGPPTPQMRRYMNPHAFQPYDFHLHNSHIDDADLEFVAIANAAAAEARALGDPNAPAAPDADVIPMNTYVRRSSNTGGAATEAGRAMEAAGKAQQRREPRENPEFLRIAVLEMQMRRAGKTEGPVGAGQARGAAPPGMGSAGVGRRGWFLPPRLDNASLQAKAGGASPRRWASVVV